MPAVMSNKIGVTHSVLLKRDECYVIRPPSVAPEIKRKVFSDLKRIVSKLPLSTMDTVAEVRLIRDSGGAA